MTPVRLRFDPIGVGCWANKSEFDSLPMREELRVRGEGRLERKQCGQWEGGCSQGCGSKRSSWCRFDPGAGGPDEEGGLGTPVA